MWPYQLDLVRKSTMDRDFRDRGEQSSGKRQKEKLDQQKKRKARLRNAKLVGRAAKDLLRAARLPLLPSDESHVEADLKRIHKGKALAPVLLVRDDIATGLPLMVADGYHRICAVCYYDESAPVLFRLADIADKRA